MAIALAMVMNVALADDCSPPTPKPVATENKPVVKKVKKKTNKTIKKKVVKKVKPKPVAVKPTPPKTSCEVKKPPEVSPIPFPFPPPGDIVIVPLPMPIEEAKPTDVPEPSSIAMIGIGLAGLVVARRKR